MFGGLDVPDPRANASRLEKRVCGFGWLSASSGCDEPPKFALLMDRSEDYSDGSFTVRSTEILRCAKHAELLREAAISVRELS